MELEYFLGLLAGAIPVALGAVIYVNHHIEKYARLRHVYERLCISILDDQIVDRTDDRAKKYDRFFSDHTSYVTAIEFLDEPGKPGQRLMGQLDRLSPSIFPRSIIALWVPSLSLTIVIVPLVLFVLGMFPEVEKFFLENFPVTLAISGALSVLVSFGMVLFISKALFEIHLRETCLLIEKSLLWETGADRQNRPAKRAIIMAKEDPVFAGLAK